MRIPKVEEFNWSEVELERFFSNSKREAVSEEDIRAIDEEQNLEGYNPMSGVD